MQENDSIPSELGGEQADLPARRGSALRRKLVLFGGTALVSSLFIFGYLMFAGRGGDSGPPVVVDERPPVASPAASPPPAPPSSSVAAAASSPSLPQLPAESPFLPLQDSSGVQGPAVLPSQPQGGVAAGPGGPMFDEVVRRLDDIGRSLTQLEASVAETSVVVRRVGQVEQRLFGLEQANEALRQDLERRFAERERESQPSGIEPVLEFLLARLAEIDAGRPVSSGQASAAVSRQRPPVVVSVPVTVASASDHLRFVVRLPNEPPVYDIVREVLPNGQARYEVIFPDQVRVDFGQLPQNLRGVSALLASPGSFEFRVASDREVRHGLFANNALFIGVYDPGASPLPQAGSPARVRTPEDQALVERRRAEEARVRQAVASWSVVMADGVRGVLRSPDGSLHVVPVGVEFAFGPNARTVISQFRREGGRWVADTVIGVGLPSASAQVPETGQSRVRGG